MISQHFFFSTTVSDRSVGTRLRKHILNLEIDGGTFLEGVKFPAHRSGNPQESYLGHLLFSDGLSVFGTSGQKDVYQPPEAEAVIPPVFAFTSSTVLDQIALQTLVLSSGGAFFDLKKSDNLDQFVASCLQSITSAPFRFISCDYNKAALTEGDSQSQK